MKSSNLTAHSRFFLYIYILYYIPQFLKFQSDSAADICYDYMYTL